ncbi:hypothetical protein [Paraconexibacter sp.]|uniref:hypothetical protein n=1 Tax=Paraconexibacter sp. TaxID=2949640 RepID=UPI0035624DCC
MPSPPAGLCNLCAFQRVVGNTRGSVFSMCERARRTGETAYPKYPPLPVHACPGFHASDDPVPAPGRP